MGLIDFVQDHNRNVNLERSAEAAEELAEAKKEIAKQARLDREANDRHRAKMEEIAKKEQEAKDFSKQQQFKLFDISCQLDEIQKQQNKIEKIKLFYNLNMNFEKIVLDAIEDLQYRNLYMQVKDALKKEQSALSHDFGREMLIYPRLLELKNKAKQYIRKQIIQTFDEMHQVECILSDIHMTTKEVPELSMDISEEVSYMQKSVVKFLADSAKAKRLLNFLYNGRIESLPQLRQVIISFYGLDISIIQSKDWEKIKSVCLPVEDLSHFCAFCPEFARKNRYHMKTILQILECIDVPQAIQAKENVLMMQKQWEEKQEQREKEQKVKALIDYIKIGLCLIFDLALLSLIVLLIKSCVN